MAFNYNYPYQYWSGGLFQIHDSSSLPNFPQNPPPPPPARPHYISRYGPGNVVPYSVMYGNETGDLSHSWDYQFNPCMQHYHALQHQSTVPSINMMQINQNLSHIHDNCVPGVINNITPPCNRTELFWDKLNKLQTIH